MKIQSALYGDIQNCNLNNYKITKRPSEDKYSIFPLYIKGFLPQQNGSSIMLPADGTVIAGFDFDVDKLYTMFPEFKEIKYDFKKAREFYNKVKIVWIESAFNF